MLKFNFTTVTPLHISNGEQLGFGLDYIIKNEAAFHKLNFIKLSEKFASDHLFDFKNDYSLDSIIKLIESNKKDISDEFTHFKVLITKPFSEHLKNPKAAGQRYVSEFINSNGKFYIPASSVKGALCTILNTRNGLGINPNDAKIADRVVFSDSDFIDQSNFNVFCSNNRPPKTNMICLKKNISFSLLMKRTGNLDINNLKKLLKEYSSHQIDEAMKRITLYKSKFEEPKGADIFELALSNVNSISLDKDEYFINIGFGGGSWFKIEKGKIPMFKSKKKGKDNPDEPAHTSVSFNTQSPVHIGWCKLKIEES